MTGDREAVIDWFVRHIARTLSVPPETIRPDTPFTEVGLSSVQAVELTEELRRWSGVTVAPTLAYDHPTIETAAAHVAAGGADAASERSVPAPVGAVDAGEPIAIVGMGCRMPGGGGLEEYWRLLTEGTDAVGEVPAERWDAHGLYDPDPAVPGRMNTRWGGFLDDVTGFDAAFFGLTAREVERMDPQQRLVLEVACEALENAGTGPASLADTATGVFMGASTYDHGAALFASGDDVQPYDGTGGALSVVANRLSYCLNLRGPSMVVDTACSSSLVAVHLACQALRSGEADTAVAGGVNVITSPHIAMGFSRGGLMAPDGRCKTFDHRADGYVRSEGVGAVVLKPLSRALADGDRVYAVVRGGAVNQDGRTNGLAAPNRLAQERVLRSAYAAAGVDPAEVDYVEAHGTGTAVGDPIEVGALGAVLGAGRPEGRPLRVGSAKSNIGHLEAAAGVAGLVKTALALHHRTLPPSIHFERPNPMLGLDRLPVRVQTAVEAWPEREAGTPLAGVSSFGFGGTNAHLVLSAAPEADPAPPSPARSAAGTARPVLVPVSARSPEALARRARGWAERADRHADDPAWLPRAAAAAALRGDHDRHRAAVVATDAAGLADAMRALAEGRAHAGVCGPAATGRRARRPVLVFPGQGSQWDGMGRSLAAAVPAFRAAVRACDVEISRWLGHSLWSDEEGLVAAGTAEVQPALFAMEVALARTWLSWGVDPVAVIGHSMGEIAAAHLSGALSLTDAARIVVERSSLLSELTGAGGLALVELDVDEAAALLRGREHELSVAALNGPRAIVLSGATGALDEVVAELEGRGVFARRVTVEFAAHSPQVEPIQPRLRAALRGIAPRPAETVLYSTVTGEPIDGRELDPEYWERNVRATVRFAPALERLLADGYDTFVEVAPHPVLIRSVDEVTAGAENAMSVSSARRDEDETQGMLRALGELYAAGVPVDWSAQYGTGAPHVDLPPHGWDHQHFPLLRPASAGAATAAARRPGTLLGDRVHVGADPDLRVWTLPLDLAGAPELADHVVDDVPLVPGAYWLAATAMAAAADHGAASADEVAFVQPCPVAESGDPGLQLSLRPRGEGRSDLLVTSLQGGRTVVHARGVVHDTGESVPVCSPLEEVRDSCPDPLDVDALYERLGEAGLRYGPRFRGLAGLWSGREQALGRVELPEGLAHDTSPLHPALLDACLHVVAASVGDRTGDLPLPAGVQGLWSRQDTAPTRQGWCHARLLPSRERDVFAEVTVYDADGTVVWRAARLRVTLAARRRDADEGRLYGLRWSEVAPAGPASGEGHWLLLADAAGTARDLADRLTAAGGAVTVAEPSAAPPDAAYYDGLLERAPEGLRAVVDLRAAVPGGPGSGVGALARPAVEATGLLQAVARRDWPSDPPRVWLVTAGVHTPDSSSAVPPGAALWGLGRVAANEHPELDVAVADLTWPVSRRSVAALAAGLRRADTPGQIRADEALLAPRLAPLPVPAADAAPLRGDRTYLVTGGLGALGLHTARWLVGEGARHLLLLGRSEPTEQALGEIDGLRAAGAEVRTVRADLADPARVGAALKGLGRRFPALGGVFHLAGVLEDALVADLGRDTVERAVAGKSAGAWHLHEHTLDQPVEHFVLFSSMAAVLGSPGQGAYAAANSQIDALAVHRQARGLPAVSIGWGPWADTGLAVSSGGADRLAARGVPPLKPETALALLDEAMRSGRPHVVASAFRWEDVSRSPVLPAARLLLDGLLESDETAALPRGGARSRVLSGATRDRRTDEMRAFLLENVGSIVGAAADSLDSAVPFQDLGFDSMMAVELRNRLESALDVRLSAAMVFAHPTVDDLAEGLLARIDPEGAQGPAPGAPPPPPAHQDTGPEVPADLSGLDDDELTALLEEELDEGNDR
ncbi:myxalamid-type polyketide synthase MxaE and MxaD [Nocardiopsis sp. Huas11]|uniref:type I polyketide synthase n=1 Tax=Nocardiopsis sp. Huas11 TaxID=2183912 RepID=UPI000F11CDD8|nr:type I polyketide synthase [Nocardiopsis sp. Huas11]RKS09660.1 myxalamid-type polyketide synthase MxaE and MxaD [Nocardiopsis sp. Huas11]